MKKSNVDKTLNIAGVLIVLWFCINIIIEMLIVQTEDIYSINNKDRFINKTLTLSEKEMSYEKCELHEKDDCIVCIKKNDLFFIFLKKNSRNFDAKVYLNECKFKIKKIDYDGPLFFGKELNFIQCVE